MRSHVIPPLGGIVLAAFFVMPPMASGAPRNTPAAKPAAAVVHPTPEEVAGMSSASDLAISPDGSRLVYSLATATLDPDAKPSEKDTGGGWKRERQIWIVDRAGGAPIQLTRGTEPSSAPVWSPDSREIAFLRKENGKAALHVIAIDGGEAETVPTGALKPGSVRWSPDGKRFAFLASPEKSKEQTREKWRSGGVVDWGREFESEALWVVPRGGGDPVRVSRGDETVVSFDWSPDGSKFAILTAPSADPYEASEHLLPRIIAARDGATIGSLPAKPAFDSALQWSPDGRHVAMLTTHETLSLQNELRVYDLPSGAGRNVLPGFDLTLTSFVWSPDSRSVIGLVKARTLTRIERFPIAGGAGENLGLAERVADAPLTIDRTGAHIAFLSSTDRDPHDPTVFDPASRTATVVARLNPGVAQWNLGRQQVVRWKSENGIEIEGLLLVSPAARPNAPAPLMVMPHGGPDAVTSDNFSPLAQFFAAHGISVFRPNYRGSLGYGHDFYAANRGRLGEIEFLDIESGVDALIAAKQADPDRLLYGGWSWGGYLTAWTIGHTDRYRAAVVGAGVNDVFVQYSLSDINHGDAAQWEYRGDPWRQLDHFDRSNPIRFARNMTTPTLILHGQSDSRVGFAASQELQRALLDLGVPVRFYAYPREPHGFREPAHNAHRARVWLDWYEYYLRNPRTAPAP